MTAAVGESEMVEVVARAIARATYGGGVPGVSLDPEEWSLCCTIARAAIEAMREPTPEMVARVSNGADSWNMRIARDWRSMIDAALAKATALQKEG